MHQCQTNIGANRKTFARAKRNEKQEMLKVKFDAIKMTLAKKWKWRCEHWNGINRRMHRRWCKEGERERAKSNMLHIHKTSPSSSFEAATTTEAFLTWIDLRQSQRRIFFFIWKWNLDVACSQFMVQCKPKEKKLKQLLSLCHYWHVVSIKKLPTFALLQRRNSERRNFSISRTFHRSMDKLESTESHEYVRRMKSTENISWKLMRAIVCERKLCNWEFFALHRIFGNETKWMCIE